MHQDLFDGKYRIIRTLGRGGTSTVFLAENVRLGSLWAIKEVAKDQGAAVQFLTEPHVLKNLRHPALPRIFDIIENEHYLYLVQDYIEGTPLDELLRREGTIAEKQLREWAETICDVYVYLHGQRPNPIIYRDMKPGNLIVDKEGHIKLIDFGIAREFKAESAEDTVCLGTRGYAAPEQYGKGQTDPRSDIYSLGVTLYHLLTGRSPSEPPYELPPLLGSRGPWSTGIARVIDRAMKADPAQRYPSAEAMLEDLKSAGREAIEVERAQGPRTILKGVGAGLGLVGTLFLYSAAKAVFFSSLGSLATKLKGAGMLFIGLALWIAAAWLWQGRPFWKKGRPNGLLLELDDCGRLKGRVSKTLAFFSPLPTGKTELAANTALALAQMGKRVALVDLDHDTCGAAYNFPVEPGESFENYYKLRVLVRKIDGYLKGRETEISSGEIEQLALWSDKNLMVFSGSQEIPLAEDAPVLNRKFSEECEPALLGAGLDRNRIEAVQEAYRASHNRMDPEVFRYLMRKLHGMVDVVVLDVGRGVSQELTDQILHMEDSDRYLVATENLKDLNSLAYRLRFSKDVDYEAWNLVVNQAAEPVTVKDKTLKGYFHNPELEWMRFGIRRIIRVPRHDGLWEHKWSRRCAYGTLPAFDRGIAEVIAASIR